MGTDEQYLRVRANVDQVCQACGRDPRDVTLVAVSKTVDIPEVALALNAGGNDFGENRPDELLKKHAAYPTAHWHFIGNVQSRRISDIVSCAHLVHSVYKPEHLPKFDAAAVAQGRPWIDLLLEVNISAEESKGGLAPDQVAEVLEDAQKLAHVRVRGLMTMAPQGDVRVAEACFADLRALKDALSVRYAASLQVPLTELSMGMSEDWKEAIAQGSTLVRIGRAIFSEDFA